MLYHKKLSQSLQLRQLIETAYNWEIIQGVLVVFYNNLARESLLAPTPLPLICQAGARFSSKTWAYQRKIKPNRSLSVERVKKPYRLRRGLAKPRAPL